MKFVNSLPDKGRRRGSRYDDIVDIDVLRRNPGKWALVAEDVPAKWRVGFHNWGERRFIETATRLTVPGGSQVDLYARAPKKEKPS